MAVWPTGIHFQNELVNQCFLAATNPAPRSFQHCDHIQDELLSDDKIMGEYEEPELRSRFSTSIRAHCWSRTNPALSRYLGISPNMLGGVAV